jgi:hypothetical protein
MSEQEYIPMARRRKIEEATMRLRLERNRRLAESDIYIVADRWELYSNDQKQAWADYRQALRDLPTTTADVSNPIWPSKPA